MKSLEEFWTKSPLKEDVKALSNPNLHHDHSREKVNGLVLNAVIKYLALYLEIASDDIGAIRDQVAAALQRKTKMLYDEDPKEGVQYDACHKGPAPGNDGFGIQCAADIRRTAAIFKEIAFGGNFVDNGRFLGLELGSGTGVMMLAMSVAATRRKIKDFYCVGIEKSSMAAKRSQEALDQAVGRNHVSVLCKDVRDEGVLSSLFKNPIHYWVSETISVNTPKIDMQYRDFGLSEDQKLIRRLEMTTDPFVEALRISMDELPLFKSYVRSNGTAMFPDVINGLYKPDSGRSTLVLKTSPNPNPVILERTAEEFETYEDFDVPDKRWESPEDVEKMAMESDL
jgi:hypothetical protein